jgi:hypothetical protein
MIPTSNQDGHPMTISSKFSFEQMVSDKKIFMGISIGSYVKLSSAVVAILVRGLKYQTQIWKGTTQKSFQQSFGQNCFILSQNVPKFELYKHNDELFNI